MIAERVVVPHQVSAEHLRTHVDELDFDEVMAHLDAEHEAPRHH